MGKRKTGLDDAQSTVEIMEGLVHDIQFAFDNQDHPVSDRVYARFLSEVEPGVANANVFPLDLGKRKTGVDDVPSAVEILQVVTHNMQVLCEKQDHAASERVYNRFLSQTRVRIKLFGGN